MKYVLLIIASLLFFNCSNVKTIHDFTKTEYRRFHKGYVYSNDVIEDDSSVYLPLIKVKYMNDSLSEVSLFKPEGPIQMDFFLTDTLLLNQNSITQTRNIAIEGDYVTDNLDRYKITKFRNDSIFCHIRDTLFLYLIHN